jgi:hypothetical protein
MQNTERPSGAGLGGDFIAHITARNGTSVVIDPLLGLFHRTPGPDSQQLAGDRSWQVFPITFNIDAGTRLGFDVSAFSLLAGSAVASFEWQRRSSRELTADELSASAYALMVMSELQRPR